MAEDLPGFLARLRAAGEVLDMAVTADPRYQVAALMAEAGLYPGPAVYLPAIPGYPGYSLAGNLLGSWRRLAMTLQAEEGDLPQVFRERRRHPVVPRLIADGPVREVTVRQHPDVMAHIPILTHYEEDAGPYITAGAVIAREPGGSRLGMGIHRIQVKGPDRLGILLASPPLGDFLRAAEARKEPLEVAIALGTAPAVTLAAVARIGPGEDKLAVAGGLQGSPVDLVAGLTVDVPAPAHAQFVIEGRVLPGVREVDGPFGESTGTYLPFHSPVIQVTGITRRQSPIYQAILPWGAEVDLLLDLTVGQMVFARLRELAPCVENLRMSLGTCGLQAVVQVRPSRREEVRRALALALTVDHHVKLAIAVNHDVNPVDAREVAWALATRMQPDRDLLLLPGLEGYIIDPSAQGGTTAKLGIDATLPPDELQRWRRIQIPAAARAWARRAWQSRLAERLLSQ